MKPSIGSIGKNLPAANHGGPDLGADFGFKVRIRRALEALNRSCQSC